jgi:hypothetical protein
MPVCLIETGTKGAGHSKPAASQTGRLAEWLDGQALDGFSLPENGEELPRDHGIPRILKMEAILSESQSATRQAVA